MRYAKELSELISVDIIGQCWDAEQSREIPMNFSTHPHEKNLPISEYKFYLAFEEISCRDYITPNYFQAAERNDIVPIGKTF